MSQPCSHYKIHLCGTVNTTQHCLSWFLWSLCHKVHTNQVKYSFHLNFLVHLSVKKIILQEWLALLILCLLFTTEETAFSDFSLGLLVTLNIPSCMEKQFSSRCSRTIDALFPCEYLIRAYLAVFSTSDSVHIMFERHICCTLFWKRLSVCSLERATCSKP